MPSRRAGTRGVGADAGEVKTSTCRRSRDGRDTQAARAALAPDRVRYVCTNSPRCEPGPPARVPGRAGRSCEGANVCDRWPKTNRFLFAAWAGAPWIATHVRMNPCRASVGFVNNKASTCLQFNVFCCTWSTSGRESHQNSTPWRRAAGLRLHIDPPEHHGLRRPTVLTIGPDALAPPAPPARGRGQNEARAPDGAQEERWYWRAARAAGRSGAK